MPPTHYGSRLARGVSMIEVMVTLVILGLGLLGLAGLQSRLQVSEIEAYQRAQALVLLEDMASRLASNRDIAATVNYITASPLGTGAAACTVGANATRQQRDSCEWNNALQGAAELAGSSRVGAMAGARGCVERVGTTNQFVVTVAWQGMGPSSVPPGSCGAGQYNNGTNCVDDRCRRAVITTVRIGSLAGL
jgi:type IV pilus assembly protein PilV